MKKERASIVPFPKDPPSWRVMKYVQGHKTWWNLEQNQGAGLGQEAIWIGVQQFDNEKDAVDRFVYLMSPVQSKLVAIG